MTIKENNILLICLMLVFSCVIVLPLGIKLSWPIWLIVATIVVFCLAFCIALWNTGYAFRSVPLERMSSKEKVSYHLSVFMIGLGIPFMTGLFGESYWLRAAGAILMLTAAFLHRRIVKNLPKDESSNTIE